MRSFLVFTAIVAASLAAYGGDYPDVEEVAKDLTALAAGSEPIVLTELAKSREGVPIRSIRLALPGTVPPEERPRLLVVAGLAPDHRIGVAVALRLGEALLSTAADDPALASLLARYTVEIIPLANPDGLSMLLAGGRRELRVNTRPVDDDRDGASGEDPPDDLNGDGIISLMRVRTRAGSKRASEEDERLLVDADPAAGKAAVWRVLTEGIDNDGDGWINEDGPGGVDLDRNFPHGWDPTRSDSGKSCPSEPESLALIGHVLGTPEIATLLVYGHESNLSTVPDANKSPPRVPPTGPPPEDLGWWKVLAEAFKEACKATGQAGEQSTGSFAQWAYYQAGLPAFSSSLWYLSDEGTPFELPDGKAPTTDDGRLLALADREGRGFVEWAPFEHETLGSVEIGGFDPLFRINPPPRLIAPIVSQQVKFVKELLTRLPRPALSVNSARATGNGVYELKVAVTNEGVLPALTAMGRLTRAPAPLRLELDLPTERILQGQAREMIDRLDGGTTAEFRWLITGKPDEVVVVRLHSARCGSVILEVRL